MAQGTKGAHESRSRLSSQSRTPVEHVDELGPVAIKKYGGRAYVRKGVRFNVPQMQNPKGAVLLAGALSATTNQLSWCYGRSKDTAAMIGLIEILFNQYPKKQRLYVTWDAASWHDSNALVEWLDGFNVQTRQARRGPLVELVPLPSSSQFLNVIESVFGGMKKAVVHHSDYPHPRDMKSAISQHFRERNQHFKENPCRAGKKIWQIDFFDDPANLRAGNYREY